jgi:NADPH2:quinone reductase
MRFFIVYNLDREQRAHAIDTLHRLLDKGTIRHNVAQKLPLARIADAHDWVGAGTAGGNVVLTLAD